MTDDARCLIVFESDNITGTTDTAGLIARRTGAAASVFTGVRDPLTGRANRYLAVAASVDAISPLVPSGAVVWPDLPVHACTYRSLSTIRADVAQRIYAATGRGIVWAVIDSGIDGSHPHFERHRNLTLPPPLAHLDLISQSGSSDEPNAPDTAVTSLTDEYGHGTYIAGIIAGENTNVRVAEKSWSDDGSVGYEVVEVPLITGIAPECRILSVKVLDEHGMGRVSTIVMALAAIQQMNSGRLQVHGVYVGADFNSDPERFACGRSPLCVEADRLVRSGVAVVVAAGNTGYGAQNTVSGVTKQGMEASIRDPGNAELVITVGSTDRERPHVYGVSYFSSKGPTLDGRPKPDMLAPGERIISCAAGARAAQLRAAHGLGTDVLYAADSGTSVAAAHVSGAAAALLSARPELVGEPGMLKAVLMNSATDLGRSPFYQGRGVLDLLQALQQNVSAAGATQLQDAAPRAVPRRSPAEPAIPMPAAPIAEGGKGTASPLRVMFSYSHQDEAFKDELQTALAALRREGSIEVWQDRQILPGTEFDKDIARALEQSDIVILLVSKYFIASEYCWGIEMTRAVERHNHGTAVVVPVILKPADWKTSPFGKLTALPKDGKPITEWQNPDAAWADVAEGIRRLVTAKRRS